MSKKIVKTDAEWREKLTPDLLDHRVGDDRVVVESRDKHVVYFAAFKFRHDSPFTNGING